MKGRLLVIVLTIATVGLVGGGGEGGEGMQCVNPVISEGRYMLSDEGTEVGETRLVQATVFQRHLDRWLYPHDLILDVCWRHQLNSTLPSLAAQCLYNLSSVWAQWPRLPDPYSAPDPGSCTPPQLVEPGRLHAAKLGSILFSQFTALLSPKLPTGPSSPRCGPSVVRLEFDNAQKNQLTAETEYAALCGGALPSVAEYPYLECCANGTVAPGTPFFLQLAVCQSPRLAFLQAQAAAAQASSELAAASVELASAVRLLTGHESDTAPPAEEDAAAWLDCAVDCVVCHRCLGLPDTPAAFLADGAALYRAVDALETASRAFPFDYFRALNRSSFLEFSQLYYGYYFRVLLDRMAASLTGSPEAVPVSIQVMSDSNITPLLKMLQLDSQAVFRPVWGSTLIFELHGDKQSSFFVRVIYNGQVMPLPGPCEGVSMCPWHLFKSTLEPLIPTPEQCPIFYGNYLPPH